MTLDTQPHGCCGALFLSWAVSQSLIDSAKRAIRLLTDLDLHRQHVSLVERSKRRIAGGKDLVRVESLLVVTSGSPGDEEAPSSG